MGQVNSTQASSSQHVPSSSPPTMPPPPPPPSSTIPSVEDMRNLTSRILASTGEKLKHLRENIPAIELPSSLSSTSASSAAMVGDAAAQEAGVAAAAMTDGLGFATDTSPVTVMTTADSQVLVYRPFDKNKASVADLIRIHYFLTVDWFKDNAKTVVVGAVVLGITAVVGTVAVNTLRAHRQKLRRLRVLKSQEGNKREIVVITNVATLEGSTLALSLEQEGFILFVGVPNQAKVDDITQWGRPDIHPVIVDITKVKRPTFVMCDKMHGLRKARLSCFSSEISRGGCVFFFSCLRPTLWRTLLRRYPTSWINTTVICSAAAPFLCLRR